jgi:hypothetical protein
MIKRNSKKDLSQYKEASDSAKEANTNADASPTKLESPRAEKSNSVKSIGGMIRRKSISIHDKQPKPLASSSEGGETKKKGIVMTTSSPSKAESQSTSPKK